jgi:hypothetical protein
MKAILLVPAGFALLAVGAVAGHQLATSDHETAAPPSAPVDAEVTFKNQYGETRTVTAAEAAERIERLEAAVARRRRNEEPDAAEAAAAPTTTGDPPSTSGLVKKDGTPYSAAELRDLAKSSDDPALRVAAIRELRRDDTDESRAVLQSILGDKSASSEVREAAATSLATPPNRDKLSEELVAALSGEGDAAVRRALAQGVSRMRDRDAYMPEIVAALQTERDADVRKSLLFAVVRDARDPVARAALLAVAVDSGASLDERRAAIEALPRGRADADTIAKSTDLLKDPDPRIRASAVAIVASAQAISPSALSSALADDDPGVRRAALNAGLGRLPQFANDKSILRADYQQLVDTAVRIAATDPDASVRRSAIQQVGNLPKTARDQILDAGRNDSDLFVKLTSYARSPDPVAKSGTNLFVGALDAKEQDIRDFAYRQLQRLDGVTAPFDSRWNAKARATAIDKIRQDLAATNH